MVSQQLLNIIIKAQDQASSTAKKVDDSLKQIGKSGSMLSKIPGFDTMRNKISGVAQTLDGKFGGALTKARNKFTSFKNSVAGVATSIKGKFGGAVDGIRSKLSGLTNGMKNTASSFGFLRGAASMAVGMLGFELVSSLVETTRASLNARSSIQAFGSRLNMSGTEVSKFQSDLDKLQGTFKKIDMDVVGQQSMDMAYRLGLPKEALTQLTETSAIFTDAMVRNGRSSEDATLALSDAMDGQFVRLKEIGIDQEKLMKNGWDGDIENKTGLLKAMNKSLKDLHYDELAKSVDTLDDAWQVLSITMSNLLESILVPLTPVIVGIVNGITGAIEQIKAFVSGLQTAFAALPEWAQIGIGIAAVAVAVGLVVGALGGVAAIVPAITGFFAPLIAAIAAVEAPVLLVVAAIGLIVAAVYEVGKAFGWWTDVGSMLDAITAGLQRMWNAFINHPDVQAAIKAISEGFQWLCDAVGDAWNAILEFFGVSTSSDFDIVRALIDGIGVAWQAMTAHIRLAIQICQAVADVYRGLWEGALVPFGEWLSGVFGPVWTFLGETIGLIMPLVENLTSAFTSFQNGQLSLPGLIMTVMSTLWGIYTTILTQISNAVLSWASSIVSSATSGASRFVMGIVSKIMALPGRFLAILNQTRLRITAQFTAWIALARARMSLFVSGIISKLSQLPGRIYSVLAGVVSTITSVIGSWVSAAKSKAGEIVSGVAGVLSGTASAISSALSGVVDAVVGPFRDAYNQAKDLASKIANLGGPRGGEEANGRASLVTGIGARIANSNSSNGNVRVDENITLTLDFKNVPSQVDTDTLVSALTDRSVISALVNNNDFQSLDAKVKNSLNLKVNRARGV